MRFKKENEDKYYVNVNDVNKSIKVLKKQVNNKHKFIGHDSCISLFSFFWKVCGYFLQRFFGCPLYGREDNEKGGQRNRKVSIFLLYRSLLGC